MTAYRRKGDKKIKKLTAREFADINDTTVEELRYFGDACIGAEGLEEDTMLEIIVDDENIRVLRSDNPWNDPVDVIYGKKDGWIIPKASISIDNGYSFCTVQEALEKMDWNTIVNMMDDEIREKVHQELAPCTNEEFLRRYLEIANNDLIIG